MYRSAIWVALTCAAACSGDADTGLTYFAIEAVGLRVPKLDGWHRERKAEAPSAEQGGVVLRLVREQAVAGAPRIDVTVTPKNGRLFTIDEFLGKNLQEMTELERSGGLRIASVDQRPIQIGPRRAYRVRHEYMLGG